MERWNTGAMQRRSSVCSHRPAFQSFTLIELLVVVAVIAILAALLLPALQRAKAMGRQATCISNLKQLMMLTHMYADENDDYFPHSRMETYNMPPGSPSWDICWLRFIWVYSKSPAAFYCPTGDKDTMGNNAAFGHYGGITPSVFQYNPTFAAPGVLKPVRRSSIANPETQFAICDSGVYYLTQVEAQAFDAGNSWRSYLPGAPWNSGHSHLDSNDNDWRRPRHPTGVCVAFVDGHVEAMDLVKFAFNNEG